MSCLRLTMCLGVGERSRLTSLVAEWIHFTLFGIILPTIKRKVYTFGGFMNSATKQELRGFGSGLELGFLLQWVLIGFRV